MNEYENQSSKLNTELVTLTSDISLLKTETPEISKKITKLNEELDNIVEIKADLAMSQAIKSGIKLNEKITSAVRKLENKSVVQLQGTELVKVVSNEILKENINNVDENRAEIDTKNLIISEGVVSLEDALSIEKASKNIEVKLLILQKFQFLKML